MRCLTLTATVLVTVLVLNVMSCDARAGSWWSRVGKSVGIGIGKDGPFVRVSFRIGRKKRAVEKKDIGKFSIESKLNPCELATYDNDMDGLVKNTDIQQIFKIAELADVFFAEADENGDDKISASEFDVISSKINGCKKKQKL